MLLQKSIVIFALTLLFFNCSGNVPTDVNLNETANMTFNMSLQPAISNNYNVTKVTVTVSKGTFADSMDLTISGETASGTFSNLKVGIYTIAVQVYEDTLLIGTGSGTGNVIAGQTSEVNITITFLTGNMNVYVNWGTSKIEKNTIVFEINTESIVNIDSVKDLVNGSIENDWIIWNNYLNAYDSRFSASYHHPAIFPSDVQLIFSLNSTGVFKAKVKTTSESYSEIYSVFASSKATSPDINRIPSDEWNNWESQYDNIPVEFNDEKEVVAHFLTLVAILTNEFGYLNDNGCIENGPTNRVAFQLLAQHSLTIKSGFDKPLFLVFSMIRHQQADYSWYNLKSKNYDEFFNSHYSPAPASTWDLNFSCKRYFDITVKDPTFSCLSIILQNDNSNYTNVKVNDTVLLEQQNAWRNELFDYATLPEKFELNASSQWSFIGPNITYISCADDITISNWNEERDGNVNPSDSWDQNPKPIVLKIDQNGTTIL